MSIDKLRLKSVKAAERLSFSEALRQAESGVYQYQRA